MKTQKPASIEARIRNSRDLVEAIKGFSLYNPTEEVIKKQSYDEFVNHVDMQLSPYRIALGAMKTAETENRELFENLKKISKDVRSEIMECRGAKSEEYSQVNNIVKLITGENISSHTRMKQNKISGLKEGESKPEFSSVSALDYKSRLGNFRALVGIIKNFSFYSPSDDSISVSSLEGMEARALQSLTNVADKTAELINNRSRIIHLFNDEDGLTERAKRAKSHIKRKYGASSPEYKATVNRKY